MYHVMVKITSCSKIRLYKQNSEKLSIIKNKTTYLQKMKFTQILLATSVAALAQAGRIERTVVRVDEDGNRISGEA